MARLSHDQKRRKKLTERERRRSHPYFGIEEFLERMLTIQSQTNSEIEGFLDEVPPILPQTNPKVEGILKEMPAITTDFASQMGCAPPRTIERKPEPGCQVAQCHANVLRKVHSHGGRAVWGWQFVLNVADANRYTVDAGFHAVWESPQGQWVDITPQSKRVMDGLKNGVFIRVPFFCEDKRYFQEWEVEDLGNGLLMFRTVRQVFPQRQALSKALD